MIKRRELFERISEVVLCKQAMRTMIDDKSGSRANRNGLFLLLSPSMQLRLIIRIAFNAVVYHFALSTQSTWTS